MNVYFLRSYPDKYQILVPSDDAWDILQTFDGTPIGKSWAPIGVQVLDEDSLDSERLPGDFPSLASHIPVFSQQAVDKLRDLLVKNGEILPLNCNQGTYFAYNVTCVAADVLELEKSQVKKFKSSGRIMRIVNYEFILERLPHLTIFKLPEVTLMNVFVTDAFVQRVQEAGLIGFDFLEVWSSSES